MHNKQSLLHMPRLEQFVSAITVTILRSYSAKLWCYQAAVKRRWQHAAPYLGSNAERRQRID
jgi:hypothetical protein